MHERLLAYIDTILGIVDKEELMDRTADFLVHEFRLSNCSLHMFEHIKRFYDGSSKIMDAIESDIWRQISDAKISASANVKKEWGKIEGVKAVAPHVCAVPYVQDRELRGMCCLYSEVPVNSLVPFVKAVIEKLGRALVTANEYYQAQVSAVTDKLTGLYNRGYFLEAIERELQRARMDKSPTSLLIFDVDNFKNFNDTYGHPDGDEVLAKISDCLRHNVRPGDIACRYGGEEFVVILPNCGAEAAYKRAEQIRITVQEQCPLTISVGLMTCNNSSITAEMMLKEADKALYKAKDSGKNQTVSKVLIDKNLGVIDVQDASSLGKV